MTSKQNVQYIREYRARPGNAAKQRAAVKRHGDRRRAWLASIRLERGCIDCGYDAHPDALDFDHREGEIKLFNISQRHRSREATLAEIAKCDVRCANCHRIKTAERRLHAAGL